MSLLRSLTALCAIALLAACDASIQSAWYDWYRGGAFKKVAVFQATAF
jgi:hypothetical protein